MGRLWHCFTHISVHFHGWLLSFYLFLSLFICIQTYAYIHMFQYEQMLVSQHRRDKNSHIYIYIYYIILLHYIILYSIILYYIILYYIDYILNISHIYIFHIIPYRSTFSLSFIDNPTVGFLLRATMALPRGVSSVLRHALRSLEGDFTGKNGELSSWFKQHMWVWI